MVRPAPRNPLTGRKRRLMKHFTTPKRRDDWSLSVNELGDLRDCEAFGNGCERCVRIGILLMVICYARHHQHPDFIRTVYSQSFLPWVMLWTLFWLITKEYDAAVGDLSEALENAPIRHKEPQYRRFADFLDNRDAYRETYFKIPRLEEMLECFDLPVICRVPRGRLDGKCYTFHREELLIYTLKHVTSGNTHEETCKQMGQRCEQRMARGYKWLIAYLDDRYDHLIGWNGMLIWRQYFPFFAEKIRQYITQASISVNRHGHAQVIPGVWFNPGTFNCAGIVDCKIYDCDVPHSGPAAPEPGSPRRPWWYEFQRAFYDGHHHVHAIKMLTFMLPNGLYAAVWGPASARRDDAQLVHWSHIDELLYHIQAVYFGCLYIFYGDHAFRVGAWRCIRGRHAPTRNGPWMNALEMAEDRVMNRTRESIEHSYGDLVQHYKVLNEPEQIKLKDDPVPVLQMIRVCHLFYNLRVCAEGNSVSSPNALNCRPPTITQYLNL